VAQPAVELKHFRPVRRYHQPRVQEALEWRSLLRQPSYRFRKYFLLYGSPQVRAYVPGRRIGAHSAGDGAFVAIVQPLVVADRGHYRQATAVREGERADLEPVKEL